MTGDERRGLVCVKFRAGALSLPRTRSILFFRSILTMRPVVAMNIPSPAGRSRSAAAARRAVDKAIANITRDFVQCDPNRVIALHYRHSAARRRFDKRALTTIYITETFRRGLATD